MNAGSSGIIIEKIERFGTLSDRERRTIAEADFTIKHIDDDQDLTREGDSPSHCPVLVEGYACCYKSLESGQRQIIAFHVPGDFCNLARLPLHRQDFSIGTLTPAKVIRVPQQIVLDWTRQHPGLALVLWRAAMIDASVSREWILNVGRRTAYQRTAHLLCEFMLRMRAAGLAHGCTCDMPFTQVELADALGLTAVHVNRTLQWLRSDSLIELSGGTLTVPNWHGLKEAAGFDAAFMHDTSGKD